MCSARPRRDDGLRDRQGWPVVYAANVRVGTNLGSIGRDADARHAGSQHPGDADERPGAADRHGRQPERRAEAQRLVQAFVGKDTEVVSRLRSATPLQVNLKVRIAEVNRSLAQDYRRQSAQPRSRPVEPPVRRIAGRAASTCHRPATPPTPGVGPAVIRSPIGDDRSIDRRPSASASTSWLARPRADGRSCQHPRRAQPDGAIGRNGELPRRRRIPDPDRPGQRGGRRRI